MSTIEPLSVCSVQRDKPFRSLPEAYTISDAIAASRIGRTKLYDEIKSGRLKSFVLCGRRLIMRDDLLKWLLAARDEDSLG